MFVIVLWKMEHTCTSFECQTVAHHDQTFNIQMSSDIYYSQK